LYRVTTPSRARRAIRLVVAFVALATFSATIDQAEARGRHKGHSRPDHARTTQSETGGFFANLFSGPADKTTAGNPSSAKSAATRTAKRAKTAESEPSTPRAASGTSGGTGIASFYGGRHHGGPTASGERFNQNAMTAAHRSAPLGSTMRVTNLNNGKSVVVRINDRGPFVRGRVIDVSRGAAEALGFVSAGLTKVKLDPV
jgi:rare lipoprotein A